MNINRDNYEEFFVLYIDNELSHAEREAVHQFVQQNPDLKAELEMLEQTILPTDMKQVFDNKEILFRKEESPSAALINEVNCEEFFVMYADNELNNEQNGLVEEFIYRHPQYQEHFELIQQVKFQPEKHIVFPDKSILYRSEKDYKVVPMFTRMRTWKMVAAAAVMLMIGGTVWYALSTNADSSGPGAMAVNEPVKNATTESKPARAERSTTTETGVPSAKIVAPVTGTNKNSVDAGIAKTKSENVPSSGEAAIRNLAKETGTNEKSLAQQDQKKDKNRSNISNAPNVQQEKGLQKNNIIKESPEKIDLANRSNDKNNQSDKSINPVQKETPGRNSLMPADKPDNNELLAAVPDDKTTTENTVAIGPVQLKSDNVFARMANENDEEFEQSDKKNKMRGFFRKVTRVFDKATSREPAEERKGVRIASFSIGLK